MSPTTIANLPQRPWEHIAPSLPLMRLPEVRETTGLPTSSIYDAITAGEFPPPVKIGARAVAWSKAQIEAWLRSRVEAMGVFPCATKPKNSRSDGRSKAPARGRVVV